MSTEQALSCPEDEHIVGTTFLPNEGTRAIGVLPRLTNEETTAQRSGRFTGVHGVIGRAGTPSASGVP